MPQVIGYLCKCYADCVHDRYVINNLFLTFPVALTPLIGTNVQSFVNIIQYHRFILHEKDRIQMTDWYSCGTDFCGSFNMVTYAISHIMARA